MSWYICNYVPDHNCRCILSHACSLPYLYITSSHHQLYLQSPRLLLHRITSKLNMQFSKYDISQTHRREINTIPWQESSINRTEYLATDMARNERIRDLPTNYTSKQVACIKGLIPTISLNPTRPNSNNYTRFKSNPMPHRIWFT